LTYRSRHKKGGGYTSQPSDLIGARIGTGEQFTSRSENALRIVRKLEAVIREKGVQKNIQAKGHLL